MCQLKRLRGLKLRQCPPPAEFFLLHLSLLSPLSFSAFHRQALGDSAVQVQFRLRPHEKKKRAVQKERKKINFLSGRVKKGMKEAGRYIGTVFCFALKASLSCTWLWIIKWFSWVLKKDKVYLTLSEPQRNAASLFNTRLFGLVFLPYLQHRPWASSPCSIKRPTEFKIRYWCCVLSTHQCWWVIDGVSESLYRTNMRPVLLGKHLRVCIMK